MTDDPDINKLRRRQLRNFLATMLLSQGVPMLVGGDEFARTQHGNNNAYCQDNEISWFSWDRMEWQKQLEDYTGRLVRLRMEHPIFRRPKFFQGRRIRGAGVKDIMWFDVDGTEMTDDNWNAGFTLCLGMMLSGDTMDVRSEHGEPIHDDTYLVLFNAFHEPMTFVLAGKQDVNWERILDTELEAGFLDQPSTHSSGDDLELCPRSMSVLRLVKGSQEDARSVAWKQRQKAQPSPPPKPGAHDRTFRDATTVEKEPEQASGGDRGDQPHAPAKVPKKHAHPHVEKPKHKPKGGEEK